jgi:5-methylcytosine-specific restriction enzyme A
LKKIAGISPAEASLKSRLRSYRPPCVIGLSVEEATFLQQFYKSPAEAVWQKIDDDLVGVDQAEIADETFNMIDLDLARNSALEGLTAEQRRKIRQRATWLAECFVRKRQSEGALQCDDCGFDPATRAVCTFVDPRSLMDVHHRDPLAEGKRITTPADFSLLCPTCHRLVHAVLRAQIPRLPKTRDDDGL